MTRKSILFPQADTLNVQYCAKVMQMIIDEYCALLSRFIANISAKHCMDCRTLNDKSLRYRYNLRDISPRYRSSETSLQRYLTKQDDISPRYIVAVKFVVTICRSKHQNSRIHHLSLEYL